MADLLFRFNRKCFGNNNVGTSHASRTSNNALVTIDLDFPNFVVYFFHIFMFGCNIV